MLIPPITYLRSVSIHVPARGTTPPDCFVNYNILFQSTFPQGERHYCRLRKAYNRAFQSTFPQGERHWRRSGRQSMSCFNPRSRKGNDGIYIRERLLHQSFNPRSRKGNDVCGPVTLEDAYCVSIHVPARGTTDGSFIVDFLLNVSIHVPARGTTSML